MPIESEWPFTALGCIWIGSVQMAALLKIPVLFNRYVRLKAPVSFSWVQRSAEGAESQGSTGKVLNRKMGAFYVDYYIRWRERNRMKQSCKLYYVEPISSHAGDRFAGELFMVIDILQLNS